MKNRIIIHKKLRIVLLGLITLVLGLIALSFSYIFINQINDKALSIVALVVMSLFCFVEIFFTVKNYSHPLAISKTAFTSSNRINMIPVLAVVMISFIGLGLLIPGFVFLFTSIEKVVKSYSLVIITMGVFVLFNCAFYFIFLFVLHRLNNVSE